MALTVLVVDDSALMRRALTQILEDAGDIRVQTARDGQDALQKIEALDPDVVTLDINMPVMDGLTCLAHIMDQCPRPVVMISSLTECGALVTFEALELGAVDYVAKPDGTVSLGLRDLGDDIVAKVRAAAAARTRRADRPERTARRARSGPVPSRSSDVLRRAAAPASGPLADGVVLVGVSTGGPRTVEEVLPLLPADFPLPVLVAQHMPSRFTEVFAARLDQCCRLKVVEVSRPTPVQPGTILVARGDADMVVSRRGSQLMALSVPASAEHAWHPSVERLVRSCLEQVPPERTIGVQLTGMGTDGADAMTELRQQGGRTIAESEETAVVFGMPRQLIELGGATCVLPAGQIAEQLLAWTG